MEINKTTDLPTLCRRIWLVKAFKETFEINQNFVLLPKVSDNFTATSPTLTVSGHFRMTECQWTMKQKRRAYYNEKWFEFSKKVQQGDGYKCLKCGRNKGEVVLQTHHKLYKRGLEVWEYPLSDCLTLCKGCHAEQHGIKEPSDGWTLISIDDLEGLYGICEKNGCGTEIRYEHLIYHPNFGYKTVGSTCVEFLTREDQLLSQDVLKVFKKISDFIQNSDWETAYTKNNKKYYFTTHLYHQIRIYGSDNFFSYQIALKQKGKKWFEFGDFIMAKNKTFEQVKELGYIVLKGKITENEDEKDILRNIYKKIR